MSEVDAVVLAGGVVKGELARAGGSAKKACLNVGNRLMVEYVVEALEGASSIDDIVVAGPPELAEVFSGKGRVRVVNGGEDMVTTALQGARELSEGQFILFVTADVPLIKPDMVDDFISTCRDREYDLYYPIVPREATEAAYSGVRRTYARLKEGVFTGGNLFLVRSSVIARCAENAMRLVKLRKNPLQLARLAGWCLLIKSAFGQVSLKEAEERFSHILGLKGKAVVMPYPEIGIDVDKIEDLNLARQILT